MDAIDTIKILGSLLGSGGLSKGSGGSVLGNLLGSALSGGGNQQTQGGGMLGDVLGSLIGGNSQSTSGGGMADLLGGLLGGGRQQQAPQGGGIGDLLGSLLSGSNNQSQTQTQGSGLGDVLGSLLGGSSTAGAGGLGGLLGGALTKYAQSQNKDVDNPAPESCDHLPVGVDQKEAATQAEILIRAMINAAKADGNIDREEQEKVIAKLGDITQAEADFVRSEFNAPLDVDAFINSVPRGMEEQVYAVSLTAIDLDTNKEAKYLQQLAKGFRIQAETANAIHEQLGAPKIFA
jgi:uncharacterized membrane protein YebE (DUF533 family)